MRKIEFLIDKFSCGYLFQENLSLLSEQAAKNLRQLPSHIYLSVCGVYFCCTVIALMIIMSFLNSLRKDEEERLSVINLEISLILK